MKIAYLILAHKNPRLIARTIEALSCEDSAFFVHIDKKSNIDEFLIIEAGNVVFTEERIHVYWAEYSMVEAILILIQQALAESKQYEYYILLSGSDYPLRSKEYISRFFDQRRGTEFISLARLPNTKAGLPLSKINTVSFPSDQPALRLLVKAFAKLGLGQRDYRKHLPNLQPYGGSTWWALTRSACQYILDFTKYNAFVCEYFAKTITPDETFFHTIFGNSSFSRNAQRGLMYDDWSDGPFHPAMLNSSHLDFFEANQEVMIDDAFGPGELLFARKFSDQTLDFLNRLDDIIKAKDTREPRS
ncbi:MAG: beta-1,6-N-acetylglucosaminyltransferase [Beijerinckiaceae bacterium]|nr:beta-1,6-N-acetylglucosaminyltransferase [Beijerinckiaceae bacterium]